MVGQQLVSSDTLISTIFISPHIHFTPHSFHPTFISPHIHFTPHSFHPTFISPHIHFTHIHFTPHSFHPTFISPHIHFTPHSFHPVSTRVEESCRHTRVTSFVVVAAEVPGAGVCVHLHLHPSVDVSGQVPGSGAPLRLSGGEECQERVHPHPRPLGDSLHIRHPHSRHLQSTAPRT